MQTAAKHRSSASWAPALTLWDAVLTPLSVSTRLCGSAPWHFLKDGPSTLGIWAVSACTHGCNHRRFSCRTLYKKSWEKTEPCLCKERSGGAGKRSAIYHECPFYLQTTVHVSYGQKPLWPQVCSVWIIVWKGPLTSHGGLSRGWSSRRFIALLLLRQLTSWQKRDFRITRKRKLFLYTF